MNQLFVARDNMLPSHVDNITISDVINDVITFDVTMSEYDNIGPSQLETDLNELLRHSMMTSSNDELFHHIEIYCKQKL